MNGWTYKKNAHKPTLRNTFFGSTQYKIYELFLGALNVHISLTAHCYCIMRPLASDCLVTSNSITRPGSSVWKRGQRQSFNFLAFMVTGEHIQYRDSL